MEVDCEIQAYEATGRFATTKEARAPTFSVLPELEWVQIESSIVEEDSGLKVRLVPEAVGHLLNRLDFGVEPLAHCIGDPVPAVGDDIGPNALAAAMA